MDQDMAILQTILHFLTLILMLHLERSSLVLENNEHAYPFLQVFVLLHFIILSQFRTTLSQGMLMLWNMWYHIRIQKYAACLCDTASILQVLVLVLSD